MSKEHKQKLQLHRHTLVDNMISDDIFNDLIASQVITTADVSRIKVGQRSRPERLRVSGHSLLIRGLNLTFGHNSVGNPSGMRSFACM